MKGIRIMVKKGFSKKDLLEKKIYESYEGNISKFDIYFSFLVNELDNYNWIIEENSTTISWNITDEDVEIEPELINIKDFWTKYEEYRGFRIYENIVFKNYLKDIIDDWNTIICIKKEKDYKQVIDNLQSRIGLGKLLYLKNEIDFLFINIDAIGWDIFTNDNEVINKIQNHLHKYKAILTIEQQNIENYQDLI